MFLLECIDAHSTISAVTRDRENIASEETYWPAHKGEVKKTTRGSKLLEFYSIIDSKE